jgi:hypothetical protein
MPKWTVQGNFLGRIITIIIIIIRKREGEEEGEEETSLGKGNRTYKRKINKTTKSLTSENLKYF